LRKDVFPSRLSTTGLLVPGKIIQFPGTGMVRRRHKRKQPKRITGNSPARQVATDTLSGQAEAALAAGHFKQAVAAFKELIKRGRLPEWVDGLDKAYAARATELAGKNMFREAAVIWEQRADTCGTPLVASDYIAWLLFTGREERAARLFGAHAKQLETTNQATVREQLAALALAGHGDVLTWLPSDDPVVQNHAAATEALRAYCSDDGPALAAALKQIPFRSPYRRFGQILKALDILEKEPEDAAQHLTRIPDTSAFAGLAHATRSALLPTREASERLQELESNGRMMVTELRGWSRDQLGFFHDADRIGDAANAKTLLDLLIRHRSLFSADFARQTGFKLLIHYPQGQRAFSRTFGELSSFDATRLIALKAEWNHDLAAADKAWRKAFEKLREDSQREKNRLRAALILRHLADLHAKFEPGAKFATKTLQDLEKSLRLDPQDRKTWIRLIAGYRERGDLKAARACLEDALIRFPEDPEVLLAAVETAIAGNAFKKAARFARSLLALDPINPKVKAILLESHLAHARKQVIGSKMELAYQELDAAASWVRSETDRGKLSLVRGIIELSDQGQEQARQHLQEGVSQMGDGLAGRLHLLLEAERLKRPSEAMLKQSGLRGTAELATQEEILKLVQAVNSLQGEDAKRAVRALEILTEPLKRGVGHAYKQAEMELICEVLHRTRQFKLLQAYAKQALKRWRNLPVFVYHALYARGSGDHFVLSDSDIDRLHRAIDQAQEAGDVRTAHRIIEWLEPPFPISRGPIGPLGPEPRPGDLESVLDELGVDTFLDMLDAFGGPAELELLRELLTEEQLRKFIEILARGEDPAPFLDRVIGDFGPFVPPIGRAQPKKHKRRTKRKPKTPPPEQGDLF
jgi:tetratricopeptide (TPR) repeat protein